MKKVLAAPSIAKTTLDPARLGVVNIPPDRDSKSVHGFTPNENKERQRRPKPAELAKGLRPPPFAPLAGLAIPGALSSFSLGIELLQEGVNL